MRILAARPLLLLAFGLLPALVDADAPSPYELPPGSFGVAWRESGVSRPWYPGEQRKVVVSVENLGAHTWPDPPSAHPAADGRYAVRLSHCWRLEGGGTAADDCWQGRTELPGPVEPGATSAISLTLTAPTRPGRFEIEFDLVQEMVNWFRLQGGQTFLVSALVRPAPTPIPSRARVALRVARALATAVGLLFFVGFGLTHFIVPPRLAPAATLLMPVVGFSALSFVGHVLAFAPVGTDVTLVPVLAACALLDVAAWRRGGRLQFRRHLPAWIAFVGALVLTSYPLVVLRDLTAMGGEIDSIVYVTRADWMRGHGMFEAPATASSEDYNAAMAWETIRTGVRQGDQYVLAAVSSLGRVRAYRMFSILMSVFHALAPPAIFALARYGFRLPRRSASVAAALVAVQPLAHYVALNSFMSQNAALAFFPLVVLSVMVALRAGPARRFVLAGLLLGGLATVYPVYVVYLVPVAALAALNQWLAGARRRPHWRWAGSLVQVGARALVVAVVAVALFPLGWKQALLGLSQVQVITSGAVGDVAIVGGNTAMYAHPSSVFGIVGHANAAHMLGLPELPRTAATAVLALVMLAFVRGVIAAPRGVRPFLAGLLVLAAACAAHQRFGYGHGRGFPYGYFKVVSLFAPLLLVVVAHGCVSWRHPPGSPRWQWMASVLAGGGIAATVFALALFNVRQQAPTLAYGHLSADRGTVELDGIGALLPPSAGLALADTRWPGRAWALHMIQHGRAFDRLQSALPVLPAEARSPHVLRFALVERHSRLSWTPGEPWGFADQRIVLWAGRRYALLERTDGALADLRFSHPVTRVGLARPLRIEVGKGLRVSGVGLSYTQQLDGSPRWLELSLSAPRGGALRIVENARTRDEALTAGTNVIRIPAASDLSLELHPPDEEARLWGVKAIGPP